MLLSSAPKDVTVDDELLNLFKGNVELYRFYVTRLGRSMKAQQVPADDYYRKHYESLVDLSLARRGKQIPTPDLFDGLRMKDINELFADRLEKSFGRKVR